MHSLRAVPQTIPANFPPPSPELTIASNDEAVTIDRSGLEASVVAGVDGLSVVIDVKTNLSEWILSESPAWIAVEHSASSLKLTVARNATADARNATLTLRAENQTGRAEAKVTVAQAGVAAPALAIASSAAGVAVDEAGRSATFAVTEAGAAAAFAVNTDLDAWTVTEAPDWITIGREAKTLTLTVQKNTSTQARKAVLTVAVENVAGKAEAAITVEQTGVPVATLEVASAAVTVPAAGGSATVDYTTNQSEIALRNSAPTWLSASAADGRITFAAEANLGADVRTGEVEIVAGKGDNVATAKVVVSQSPYTQSLVYTAKLTTDGKTASLPTLGSSDAAIAFTVDWGDGSAVESFEAALSTANKHTYEKAGEYKVTITSRNKIDKISFANGYSYIKSLDANTLDLSGVKSLSRCFYQCRLLESVCAETFSACVEATDASNLFYGCILLQGVPAGIFDNLKKVTNFGYCFQNAEKLASIPAGLFAGCTAANNFMSVFYHTAITELPSRCFAGCTGVKGFNSICNGCKSLTRIAADAFEGCTSVTSFMGAFSDCSALTAIPEELFAAFPKLDDMSYCFARCGLKSLPAGLFDNNRMITSLDFCFQKCVDLTGESPYTMVDGVKVHLYERQNYPDTFVAPRSYDYCFTADEGLTDYPAMRLLTGDAAAWAMDY